MTAVIQTVQEAHFVMCHAHFIVMRGTDPGLDQTARLLLCH